MSAAFDLSLNPFHVLNVSVRANREDISSAFHDALAQGRSEEAVLHRAQQLILAPKTRIDAELSWLLTIAPNASRRILDKIQNDDEIDVVEEIGTLRGIDLANLAADLCVRVKGQSAYVEALIEAYQDISSAEIYEIVSSNRRTAGLPPPTMEMVDQALSKLRKTHAKAALECIVSVNDPAAEMVDIVSNYLSNGTGSIANVISGIIREYDAWSEPRLGAIKERIDASIETYRSKPKELSVEGFQSLLEQWDKISQPVQLFDQHKGHEEPRSREVYTSIRNFSLWLANENHQYEPSLAIARALLATFPELPLASAQLNEDISTLIDLLNQQKFEPLLTPLEQASEAAKGDITRLKRELSHYGFGPRSRGLPLILFNAFQKAVNGLHSTAVSDAPWLFLRDLALTLNNTFEAPEAALPIIRCMLDFEDKIPSDEIRRKLSEDLNSVERNSKWNLLLKADSLSAKMSLVDQLLTGANDEEAATLSAAKSALQQQVSSQRRSRVAWLVGACIFGLFLLYVQFKDNNENQRESSQFVSASESIPSTKPNQLLGRSEVRFCLFQAERLEILRSMISKYSDTEVQRFNSLIDHHNERCADFRYRQADLNAVNAELPTQRLNLKRQAETMLRAMRSNP